VKFSKLLLSLALVCAFNLFAPREAAAQCGGDGEVPCYDWSWCAYTTPSIFGDVCWGGLVASGPYNGCDNNRLNNYGLFCASCGGSVEPTCGYGPACNDDQRYTEAVGFCWPCGQTGQPTCLSGPSCDVGNRPVFGFCSYSGFSDEPSPGVATMPTLVQSSTGPVRGIADLHTHPFSNLGFGGVVFWGAPFDLRGINYALPWCDYTWDFSTEWAQTGIEGPIAPSLGYEIHGPKALQALTHPISNALPEGQHDVSGTGPFTGWPTSDTYTHQMMYYKWLERAYLGGVRLIVEHMVSNEALCNAGKRRSDWTCDDMEAVDRQIQASKALEFWTDLLDDGQWNGSGWYQIAYSPSQARDIIRRGKLAVVLGIEVDSLFGCKPNVTCTRDYLRGKLQSYYAQGIRHVFPIHQFDNAFGGAALFQDDLNAGNIVVAGKHFEVYDCSDQGYTYNVDGTIVDVLNWITAGHPLPDQSYYDQFKADCNARGLTDAGRDLIAEMMDQKFIIDTDHMGRKMVDEVMQIARTTSEDRPKKYPLVSSHSWFQEKEAEKAEFSVTKDQLAIFKEIGGMVTVGNPKGGCDLGFKDQFDYALTNMKKSDDDQFPGIAFWTDVNGFAGSTAARIGNAGCTGQTVGAMPYPFTGIMGGTFNRQVTGQKTYDFNTMGEAHYGLIADFFADLKYTGTMSDADFEPLLNSAETYIRLWEAVNSSDQQPPPSITPVITGTQGTGGWYTSDVTLTWNVQAAFGTPTKVGCDTSTVTADTSGVTFTCTATNGTGESSTSSVTIKRDSTPPTFTATRTTPAPASGWTNQSVVIHFTASDTRSGIGGATTADVTLSADGGNQTASYTFYDRAGNPVVATYGGINIDKTKPKVGFRFANLPETATPQQIKDEQTRWHNGPVTLLVDAHDDLSGVDTITPAQITFSTEGGSLRGSTTVVDRAGNSVTVQSDPIRIDLTPPTITFLSRLPAANAAGWNRTPVDVSWRCNDALSGAVDPGEHLRVSTEGDNQSATQTCTDRAGNTASNTVNNIRIDLTPPTLTFNAQQPPANVNGWNRTDVALPFVPADALSGVASTSIPSPLVLTAEGAAINGGVTVTDVAGNTASFTSPSVKIDKTAPVITFVSRLPAANENGWNNTDITATWSCADGLSGVVSPQVAQTLSTEGANQSLTGTCVDLADNPVAATVGGLSLDKTPPVVQCLAAPGELWPPNNQMRPVTVALTFTDALSGTWSYTTTDVTSSEPAAADADIAGFLLGSTSLTGSLRAQRNGDGSGRIYSLGYLGRDLAGNTASCSTMIVVPHDHSPQQ
jgi:microsomal dipeptidase-like Zn-dependent dipeptidase